MFTMRYLVGIFTWLTIHISAYQRCEINPLIVNPTAEARFAFVTSVRQSSGNEECVAISQNALQYIAAVEWAVDKINKAGFLKGMSVGFDIYDDCGLDRLSVYSVLNSVSEEFPAKLRKCTGNSTVLHLGIVGTSRSQTTSSVLQMLSGTNIPVVSPFASLPELRDYPNFLRTTPADSEQIHAIVQLMTYLGWTYVAALHTDDNYGSNGISRIKLLAEESGICVNVISSFKTTEYFSLESTREQLYNNLDNQQKLSANENLGVLYFGQKNVIEALINRIRVDKLRFPNLDKLNWIMSDFIGTSTSVFNSAPDYSAGILTLSTSSIPVQEIQDYYWEKWNTRYANYQNDPLKQLMNEVGQSEQVEAWRNDYITPVLDAVYAVVAGLESAFETRCQQYSTICNGFEMYLKTEFLSHLKAVNFTYSVLNESDGPEELIKAGRTVSFDQYGDMEPDPRSALYDINMFQENGQFVKVGEFTNGALHINNTVLSTYQHPISQCVSVCMECITKPDIPYQYVDGGDNNDGILLGLFTLHDLVEDDPFECGQFRNYTLDVIGVEAFFHAVERLRGLVGMNFSALAFDSCYSPNRGSYVITQFLTGQLIIDDGKGGVVDPKRVVAVIGPYSSGETVPMTFLFMRMGIPVIGYAASSPDLDDRINFPYYLRTVPSDVDQTSAMIDILTELGTEYVGMIYVDNNYGSKGADMLLNYANQSKICVATPIKLSEDADDTEEYNAIDEMKRTKAEVFIYFGTDTRIAGLVDKMKIQNYRDVIFIGSEDTVTVLPQNGEYTRGSITSKIETVSADQGFADYIRDRQPSIELQNSWFRDFWADFFKCNPPGGFDKRYSSNCNDSLKFTADNINSFLANQRIVHIMNAVYAVGQGLKEVKSELCLNTELPCANLRTNPCRVVELIKNAQLMPDSSSTFFNVFNSEGNGNVGFTILNLQKEGAAEYVYREVGEYKNNRLTLYANAIRFYDSNGDPKTLDAKCTGDVCMECHSFTQTTSTPAAFIQTQSPTEEKEFGLSEIVLVALMSFLCIIFLVSILVITCYFKKKMKELRIRVLENKTKVMYVNSGMSQIGDTFRGSDFTPGDIHFENSQSNGSVMRNNLNRDKNSFDELPSNAFVNEGFLPESYLQICPDGNSPNQDNSVNNKMLQYSPLNSSQQTGGIIDPDLIRIKKAGAIPKQQSTKHHHSSENNTHFKPELPPRDHPLQKQYNSQSSLDSGNITPTGFPKMGTRPAIINGHISNGSGTPSPSHTNHSNQGNRPSIPTSTSSPTNSPRTPEQDFNNIPDDLPPPPPSLIIPNFPAPVKPPVVPNLPSISSPRSPNHPKQVKGHRQTFNDPSMMQPVSPQQAQHRKPRLSSSGTQSPETPEKISRV